MVDIRPASPLSCRAPLGADDTEDLRQTDAAWSLWGPRKRDNSGVNNAECGSRGAVPTYCLLWRRAEGQLAFY